MRLHVVRHGESVNNAGLAPVPDPPLTPLGRAQADWLGACWPDEAFDGLICSPLWRTLQTAEPLLATVRMERTVAWPALMEWNRSNPLDGHPPAEIAARPPAYQPLTPVQPAPALRPRYSCSRPATTSRSTSTISAASAAITRSRRVSTVSPARTGTSRWRRIGPWS